MLTVAKLDSKDPNQSFQSDRAEKWHPNFRNCTPKHAGDRHGSAEANRHF